MARAGGSASHRRALSRVVGAGRPVSSSDQRILVAVADGPAGDLRPRGEPSLAQPVPGADLVLFASRLPMSDIAPMHRYRTIWIFGFAPRHSRMQSWIIPPRFPAND